MQDFVANRVVMGTFAGTYIQLGNAVVGLVWRGSRPCVYLAYGAALGHLCSHRSFSTLLIVRLL